MKRILMVCLGNICRSPLAEGILRHKADKLGLAVEVDSAGTAAYHAGESPDERSVAIARKHGIDISRQKARKLVVADFDRFDKIFVMDHANYAHVVDMARSAEDTAKIDLIMNMAYPDKNKQVPDPYYGGREGFQHVFDMLDLACERIINQYS